MASLIIPIPLKSALAILESLFPQSELPRRYYKQISRSCADKKAKKHSK